MANLLSAEQAHEETVKMEKIKSDNELEIVAGLIRDAINEGRFHVSTNDYVRLNWRTSAALTQLGYSVKDWNGSTLIDWENINRDEHLMNGKD